MVSISLLAKTFKVRK